MIVINDNIIHHRQVNCNCILNLNNSFSLHVSIKYQNNNKFKPWMANLQFSLNTYYIIHTNWIKNVVFNFFYTDSKFSEHFLFLYTFYKQNQLFKILKFINVSFLVFTLTAMYNFIFKLKYMYYLNLNICIYFIFNINIQHLTILHSKLHI